MSHFSLLLLAVLAALPPVGEKFHFDFESTKGLDGWTAYSGSRAKLDVVSSVSKASANGPRGKCLHIDARAGGGVYSSGPNLPRDWRHFGDLIFWAKSNSPAGTVMEVRMLEGDKKTHFWRRVDLKSGEWQKVDLPLEWFRTGPGRVSRWDEVRYLDFHFRSDCSVDLDTIRTTAGEATRNRNDLIKIAFPKDRFDRIRMAENEQALVLANCDLDELKLLAHLTKVRQAVNEQLPFIKPTFNKPCLIVFANRDQFRNFAPRFAKHLGAEVQQPNADGFTLEGIATSYFDLGVGEIRPVFTHEFIHSYLTEGLLLPNKLEWLQEGFAVHFQMQFHPSKNLADNIQNALVDGKRQMPLRELCAGGPTPLKNYWQAMTVVELLLKDKKYREKFPKLIEAFADSGSTNLAPHIDKVLNVSFEQFEKDWQEFCRKEYKRRISPAKKTS